MPLCTLLFQRSYQPKLGSHLLLGEHSIFYFILKRLIWYYYLKYSSENSFKEIGATVSSICMEFRAAVFFWPGLSRSWWVRYSSLDTPQGGEPPYSWMHSCVKPHYAIFSCMYICFSVNLSKIKSVDKY